MSLTILSPIEKKKLKVETRQVYSDLLDRFNPERPSEYTRAIQEIHPKLDTDTIRNLFNRRLPLQLALLVECIKILKPDFDTNREQAWLTANAA